VKGSVRLVDAGILLFGRADSVPVALLNVSDWRAAEAAVSNPPCAPCLPRDTRLQCAHSAESALIAHHRLRCSDTAIGGGLSSDHFTVEVLMLFHPSPTIQACGSRLRSHYHGRRHCCSDKWKFEDLFMQRTRSLLRVHRRDVSGIDTIELDIWTTLVPPNGYTAATVWADLAPPNARVINRTAHFGMPMNVTLVNATTHLVCVARHSP